MKVESAEIPEKDCLVDQTGHPEAGGESGSLTHTLITGSRGAPAGGGVVWRFFGLPDTNPVASVAPRIVYVVGRGKETAAALTFVLDKPRAVRGVLLFDPLIDDLPPRIVSRLHAVRCPGIIVVSSNGDDSKLSAVAHELLRGPFRRMPNMSFRVVDSAECMDIGRWQRLVEQMPHRYSMKARHREIK